MKNQKLRNYAKCHNLQVASAGWYDIIIGFNDYDEAQRCADELEGDVCYFTKKPGQHFWSYENHAHGPYEINEYWLGPDDMLYGRLSDETKVENEFFLEIARDILNDDDLTPESLDFLVGYLQELKIFHEKRKNLKENEQLLIYEGRLNTAEVVPIYTTHFPDIYHNGDNVVGVRL